jgi:sterol desaturase/sphingolipid hydroxylase (fatty acid hydroxylase superfamily)
MMSGLAILRSALDSLQLAAAALAISVLLFGCIALAVKGRQAIEAGMRAVAEVRMNLAFYFFDALFVAPGLTIAITALTLAVSRYSLPIGAEFWSEAGRPVTFIAVLFLGDFVSYWRHRVEHTTWFWPAHVIHHSDTDMTWLTLSRFHPINRITTALIDTLFLALLGFPTWALVANNLVRHYYGEFIHADLPWTYGRFGTVLVSPAMHRWHHARDVVGSGSNFATVFSVFDKSFGTFFLPGPCNVPLGVTEDQYPGRGVIRHMIHPLTAWSRSLAEATGLYKATGPAASIPQDDPRVVAVERLPTGRS